jgi:hypothetical protein
LSIVFIYVIKSSFKILGGPGLLGGGVAEHALLRRWWLGVLVLDRQLRNFANQFSMEFIPVRLLNDKKRYQLDKR